MTIPVLVPYRSDGGHRDKLWDHLQAHYWADLAENYRLVHGSCTGEAFNRSEAINAAAREAGDWDVAVIADADTWVPPAQLHEAVETAQRTGSLVAALTSVIELGEQYTMAVLAGQAAPMDLDAQWVRTEDFVTQSSMLAVPRPLWDAIGGFDEAFVGWGGEDNAFWKAAAVLGGTPLRINGAAFHLWHPCTSQIERMMSPLWRANWARFQRYVEATCECSLRKVQRS